MDGDEIRRRREAAGWTQQQLAERVKVGVRTVSGWERNESVPRSRMGMLEAVLGEYAPAASARDDDPLRQASDFALLSELLRRALDRQRQA